MLERGMGNFSFRLFVTESDARCLDDDDDMQM